MSKTGKITVFVIVSFVIIVVATIIKELNGGAFMWIAAIVIGVLYKSLFSKKATDSEDTDEITLKKE
jgi:hypothetical protein